MKRTPISRDPFTTEHLKADLKGVSLRGGMLTLVAQGTNFLLQIGSVAVLARLLTPADFGLIAMVTAITGFVGIFKDAGLSMATVQRNQITHEQVSTLFWINVALSSLLMVSIAAIAPLIAWFYAEPRLVPVTLAFAGIFLLTGLSIQHRALLYRQMRFGTLAVVSVVSVTLGVVAAVVAAAAGMGYWALVIQTATSAAANTTADWITCRWRPCRPVQGSGVRSMLVFGGHLTGFNFINYFARNADNVLIGRWWGAGPLGFYSKAYQLLMLPITQINDPVSSVALPALSRLQNDPQRFKRFYYKAISLITSIGMPIVAFLFVEARDVILVILGDQWLASVPIFRALSIAAFLGTFNVAGSWVCVALGHTARQLKWQLIATPIILISFICGIPWGAIGVALVFSLAQLILRPWALWYFFKGTFLSTRELALVLARPGCASVAAATVLYFSKRLLFSQATSTGAAFVGGSVIYVAVYIAGSMTTPSSRREISQTIHMIKSSCLKRNSSLLNVEDVT